MDIKHSWRGNTRWTQQQARGKSALSRVVTIRKISDLGTRFCKTRKVNYSVVPRKELDQLFTKTKNSVFVFAQKVLCALYHDDRKRGNEADFTYLVAGFFGGGKKRKKMKTISLIIHLWTVWTDPHN